MPGPEPDAHGLARYVEAIESAFTRRRGRSFRLIGPDFALARRLHAAGLPLDVLLDEWALACRQGPEPGTLAFLEARLLARAAGWRGQGMPVTPHADATDVGPDPASTWLQAVQAQLTTGARLPAAVLLLLPEVVALLAAGHTASTATAWRDEVRAFAERLEACALANVDADARARYRTEAQHRLARQAGRLEPTALALALARYERRRACEELGLPLCP